MGGIVTFDLSALDILNSEGLFRHVIVELLIAHGTPVGNTNSAHQKAAE